MSLGADGHRDGPVVVRGPAGKARRCCEARARGCTLWPAYAFLHLPMLVLAAFSFNSLEVHGLGRFSLRWYSSALSDPRLAEATLNSLVIALVATAASTMIGTLCAYGCGSATHRRYRHALYLSLVDAGNRDRHFAARVLSMAVPVCGRAPRNAYRDPPAHVAFSIAFVVIVVIARLRTFDPALEEAALDLGASEWRRIS